MALDAYSPCPCGSGKKFKWCCQPFYSQIERAFQLDANGQHEAAAAALAELVERFPDNAEVWGRRAELFWNHSKLDEAEAALDQAFKLNPRYAAGYHLRGMFRHQEREFEGALMLYRKAFELVSPDTRDLIVEIQVNIAQCELYRQRLLAAHAALEIALRLDPANETAQNLANQYFGVESPYPAILRKKYALKPLPATAGPTFAEAWRTALEASQSGKLTDALKAFEKLVQDHPKEPAGLFNLGLIRAWLGDNAGAIAAWDHYAAVEADAEEVAATWALAEALRQARGMAEYSDWLDVNVTYRVNDLRGLVDYLGKEPRLVEVQQPQQGVLAGQLLDREMPAPREDLPLYETPRRAATLIIMGNNLVLAGSEGERFNAACQYIESQLGALLGAPQRKADAAGFREIAEAIIPIRIPKLEDAPAQRLIDAALRASIEEEWPARRLKSLGYRTCEEAMTCAALRPRVAGLVKFMEDVSRLLPFPLSFDGLRQKLEAVAVDPDAVPPPLAELEFPTLSWKPKTPLADCSVEELLTLPLDAMNVEDLRHAFQAAQRHQHPRLTFTFAEALLEKMPEDPDLFPIYQALVHAALHEGDGAAALRWLDQGTKADAERNQGLRSGELELLRTKVLLANHDGKAAYDAFVKLIHRAPNDLELLGQAAEAMLKAGLRPQAAQFADHGLAHARAKGDRGRQGYFQELLGAAKRG